MIRICAYVQDQYAKANYKNECLDTRGFVGLRVIIDALARSGYTVEWAGIATVHTYDVVLVSLTSDCDWWTFVAERLRWQKGDYRVIVGGAGVLNVWPFLPYADYFSLGRGEKTVVELVRALDGQSADIDDSIVESSSFSPDRIYHIRQEAMYTEPVEMGKNQVWRESAIGCDHKCLFCGYTWHRRFCNTHGEYALDNAGFGNADGRERAILDMFHDADAPDFAHLRTTAMDGMSERLRYMVNKRISRAALTYFLQDMLRYDGKPHQVKLYNIVGLPTETHDDWGEFLDVLHDADAVGGTATSQWSIVLHCTPFRPMPATPLACAPASLHNYRGEIGRVLGTGLKGNLIYQGRSLWCVEGMGTDSLSTMMLSMIAHRGTIADADNIAGLCRSSKFWKASGSVKEATLSRYFDVDALFGEFTPQTLPTRWLRTYAQIEKMWEKPAWKEPWVIKP